MEVLKETEVKDTVFKQAYEAPALLVVEVHAVSCILQMSTQDYVYGDLDEVGKMPELL